MKNSAWKLIYQAIADRRLYNWQFFWQTGPALILGLYVQFIIYRALNLSMFFIYLPIFIMLIVISGLGSKNVGFEFHSMGYSRGFIFLLAGVLASTFPFIIRPENDIFGFFKFLLTFSISNIALTIAIIEITVWGQRVSLRSSLQLTDDFFKNQKKEWERKIEDFPYSKKILSSFEDSKFVTVLFDRGSFDLTVLWLCSVMEKIVDIITEEIISRDPAKMKLFRREDNRRLGYPKQLQNLGFKLNIEKNRKNEQLTLEALWHEIRNKIAHKNYKPTFQETSGAIYVFVSFIKEMPDILQTWKD